MEIYFDDETTFSNSWPLLSLSQKDIKKKISLTENTDLEGSSPLLLACDHLLKNLNKKLLCQGRRYEGAPFSDSQPVLTSCQLESPACSLLPGKLWKSQFCTFLLFTYTCLSTTPWKALEKPILHFLSTHSIHLSLRIKSC